MAEGSPYTSQELNRIRWQCRRGMKELDLLIEQFFEDSFNALTAEQQKTFVRMLEESDLSLFRWLLRGESPSDPSFAELIEIMRSRYARRIQGSGSDE